MQFNATTVAFTFLNTYNVTLTFMSQLIVKQQY